MTTETLQQEESFRQAFIALCGIVQVDPETIEEENRDHYGLSVYSIDGQEYAIGTDEEADAAAKCAIEESLWAFNAEFILGECGLDLSGAESLRDMQGKACEGAQDFIASLIKRTCGLDSFCEEAVRWDGRGHFLSPYDGEEIELLGGKYYAYKI
jgi:hypothetical protein